MHPAPSIIVFTTLSGAGLGLGFWLGLSAGNVYGPAPALASFMSAAITSLGLMASLLHLRRPSRAWRALSQWRSSWLSREGIVALLFVSIMSMHTLGTLTGYSFGYLLGPVIMILAPVVVLTTAMIYTQLRAIPAWHTWLTPVMFLSFATASGLFLLMVLGSLFQVVTGGDPFLSTMRSWIGISVDGNALLLLATVCNIIAWLVMLFWWRHRDRTGTGGTTIGSATRLDGFERISQLDPPHTEPNYLVNEMGYRVARKHAVKLRWISILAGCILPACFCWLAITPSPGTELTVFSLLALLQLSGIAISRWLFFAEAVHVQSLYYGH